MIARSFISPKQFATAFVQVARDNNDKLAEIWLKKKAYTELMRGELLPYMAKAMGLRCQREYYYIDSVFFREHDKFHFPEGIENAKYFDVAIEHEHDITRTAQEMNKLQLFNAPLKVLITYDDTGAEWSGHLREYEEIISSADIFEDIATTRRQLVIFGRLPSGGKIEWSTYVYEKDRFVPLEHSS